LPFKDSPDYESLNYCNWIIESCHHPSPMSYLNFQGQK
jgi:hypothetical protein